MRRDGKLLLMVKGFLIFVQIIILVWQMMSVLKKLPQRVWKNKGWARGHHVLFAVI